MCKTVNVGNRGHAFESAFYKIGCTGHFFFSKKIWLNHIINFHSWKTLYLPPPSTPLPPTTGLSHMRTLSDWCVDSVMSLRLTQTTITWGIRHVTLSNPPFSSAWPSRPEQGLWSVRFHLDGYRTGGHLDNTPIN